MEAAMEARASTELEFDFPIRTTLSSKFEAQSETKKSKQKTYRSCRSRVQWWMAAAAASF